MDLGETIKSIRKRKGIRQNTFAEHCEITQAYLSQIENNLKEPNLSTLKKIADKLSVPLPILFFLSMNEDDVASDKKEVYTMIAPSVQSLINQFFSSAN